MRAAFACLLLVCIGGAVQADPANIPGAGESSPSNGELITKAGNRLRVEMLRLDCHGLVVRYFGNTVVVPLDTIATAASRSDVPVFPRAGRDRLSGRLIIRSGAVAVDTRELGQLHLPIAAIRCTHDRRAVAAAARKPAGIRDQPLSDLAMARVTGTGPGDGEDGNAANSNTSNAPASGKPPAAKKKPKAADAAAPGSTASVVPADQKTPPGTAAGNNTQPPATPGGQREESERNTLEFLRSEAIVTRPNKVESDFSIGYLHTSEVLGNQKLLIALAQARYGLARGLEGFIGVPLVYGQRQTFGVGNTSNEIIGIGDVKFGLKYNLINENVGVPAMVIGLAGTAPTGRPPYLHNYSFSTAVAQAQGGDTRDPLNPQIGTGHWQITGSATALKSFDPVVLFGTVNYTHFVPAIWYGTHIAPGDIFEFNTGFGFSVNDRGTFSSQVFIDYVRPWYFNDVKVPQTGITPISLRLAYTHILTTRDLLEPSVLFGLTRDATDAVVILDWIHRF